MRRASSSEDEILVPARNVCVHGFTGGPSLGATSSLSIGRSSEAGVPGGSSSYATSEKTTRPMLAFSATSRRKARLTAS